MDDYSAKSTGEIAELIAAQDSSKIIQKLSKKEHLELIGKLCSAGQILAFLSCYPDNQVKEKIAPIFVGMDQDKFEEVLLNASDKQLEVLKIEGYSEGISHHLTLFVHRLEEENISLFKSLSSIESMIQTIDPELTTKETIEAIRNKLNECLDNLHKIFGKVRKILPIVWSTANIDLIDKLNKANISLQRMLVPEELQALFNQKLFSVYRDLKDDDQAIDGLANFSVWYLEDYVDVGLLPLNSQQSEQSRENLFKEVRDRLQKINLRTVSDLKEAYIFSRQTLKEYIISKLA